MGCARFKGPWNRMGAGEKEFCLVMGSQGCSPGHPAQSIWSNFIWGGFETQGSSASYILHKQGTFSFQTGLVRLSLAHLMFTSHSKLVCRHHHLPRTTNYNSPVLQVLPKQQNAADDHASK